jgi:predicted transposase YbfD/YdcC
VSDSLNRNGVDLANPQPLSNAATWSVEGEVERFAQSVRSHWGNDYLSHILSA